MTLVTTIADCGLRIAEFVRESDQRLEPVADGVGVRQFAFVRQDFPGGIKQRSRVESRGSRADFARRLLPSTLVSATLDYGKPRFHVLLKTFLRFQVGCDDDNGRRGKIF